VLKFIRENGKRWDLKKISKMLSETMAKSMKDIRVMMETMMERNKDKHSEDSRRRKKNYDESPLQEEFSQSSYHN